MKNILKIIIAVAIITFLIVLVAELIKSILIGFLELIFIFIICGG